MGWSVINDDTVAFIVAGGSKYVKQVASHLVLQWWGQQLHTEMSLVAQ